MQEVVHKRFIYLYPLSVQVNRLKTSFSKSGMRAQQSLETRRKMFFCVWKQLIRKCLHSRLIIIAILAICWALQQHTWQFISFLSCKLCPQS